MYFARDNNYTEVSEDPVKIADDLRPNALSLAAYIFTRYATEEQLQQRMTSIKGVERLLPGDTLTVESGRFNLSSHDPPSPDPDKTLRAVAVELREKLQNVTKKQLLSKEVTADLSGGKDSSTLALLAAQRVPERPLHAFMAYTPSEESDLRFAQQYGQLLPNISFKPLELSIQDFNTEEAFTTGWQGDIRAQLGSSSFAFAKMYYKEIDKIGGDLHLSGVGGDEILQAHPSYLVDILRQRRLKRFMVDTIELARAAKVSPLERIGRMAKSVATSPRQSMLGVARCFELKGEIKDMAGVDVWHLPQHAEWIAPAMRKQLAELAYARADTVHIPEGMGLADYMAWWGVREGNLDVHATQQALNSLGYSVTIHAPFLDKEIVETCLSIDATKRADTREFKKILNLAMKGIIPQELLDRQSKGSYKYFESKVARQRYVELKELLKDSRLAAHEIIDPSAIMRTLQSENTYQYTHLTVERIILAEKWLRGLESRCGTVKESTYNLRATPRPSGASKEQSVQSAKGLYTLNDEIYAVNGREGDVALLNARMSQYLLYTGQSGELLRTVMRRGELSQVVEEFLEKYPNLNKDKLCMQISQYVEQLTQEGILKEASEHKSLAVPQEKALRSVDSEGDIRVYIDKKVRTSIKERVLAFGALASAAILHRTTSVTQRRAFLEHIQRHATKEACDKEVETWLAAVQKTWWLGRVACIESSYSAALIAALHRRSVDWHLGVSFDPYAHHAWLEVGGKPVELQPEAEAYQSFFRSGPAANVTMEV